VEHFSICAGEVPTGGGLITQHANFASEAELRNQLKGLTSEHIGLVALLSHVFYASVKGKKNEPKNTAAGLRSPYGPQRYEMPSLGPSAFDC
jgi:hypothetical protein